MASLLEKVTDKKMSRRTFLAATAAGTAGLALSGCGNALTTVGADFDKNAVNGEGQWITAACWHNCGGRCLNKALVVDGVVVRQKTDDTHPDSPDYPQQRGCLRGRSQQKLVFGADRLKYPMKRKHWQPGGGDKSLRGRDEWERISWDEALDYVADELKKAKDNYGNRSILYSSFVYYNVGIKHKLLSKFGGFTQIWDSTSFGTYNFDAAKIGLSMWDYGNANDRFDLRKAETIVLYGCNPAWASAGNPSYHFLQAKKAGAKFIFVGPSYNISASVFDAEWIPVHPGTDVAFLLAVAHTLITEDDPLHNPLIDWDFLNRCSVGFDVEHMPEQAKTNENFKDYVLGLYDGQPKTPEWATEICGTPVDKIRWYAREIRKDKKVSLLHSYAPARNRGAEDFPQMFMTIGAMTGHMGKPGHSCGPVYHTIAGNCGGALVSSGSNQLPKDTPNPVDDCIIGPEVWDAVLNGKYHYTGNSWINQYLPGEDRDIDIHVIFHDHNAALNLLPDINKGIEAHRKVDFVVDTAMVFRTEAFYSDIVLPITTQWERVGGFPGNGNREMILAWSQVTEPYYESKNDQWIMMELAKRLDIDPNELFPFDEKQQFFNQLAGSTVINEDGITSMPLLTITQADLDEWGCAGTPQQGKIGIKEFLDKGIYQVERHEGDNFGFIAHEAYVKDPEKNPRKSASGKFEIYCQWKEETFNALGHGERKLKPYPSYTVTVEGYEKTFTDLVSKTKGEYPYLIYNPHYIRRPHSSLDNVLWLREAFPNPIMINAQDAEKKGIKSGDTIIVWNSFGKILRPASVTQAVMPGCIALPHGLWLDLDEKTGIDRGGAANTICGTNTDGIGITGYNNSMVDFAKYDGEALIPDWQKPQRIVNLD
ncbi:dimethyl sulfoxide reductase subunit A [Desulfitobacterium hafniense]|uniref:Dimethyl sulfoxide reductase subunit A n=1 Tax=Desulfitobacterium hafniense TaxID=49338 RepID=A0A0W1JEU7_DESHA|nr:molybdopterin-dependent oxidoreductase [Desulfitobacterium hafniense]KTE90305.1 dimethyl sulfoxide reductase subunit A [Desulfitobacterium hafniense]